MTKLFYNIGKEVGILVQIIPEALTKINAPPRLIYGWTLLSEVSFLFRFFF